MSAPAARPQQQPNGRTVERDPNAALLDRIIDRPIEIMPFQAKESITLTPRLVQQVLCPKTKSGKTCDEQQALKFVMLCKARGLNPWEGDAYIVGYDSQDGPTFSLITAHQAFLKRAEVHPEFDGMDSGALVRRGEQLIELIGDFVDDGEILVGGWATVYFKSRKYPMRKRLRLSTFNQHRSRWKVDPAGMIVKCAESDALRSSFPTLLGGMYLEGEAPEPLPVREVKEQPLPVGRQSVRPTRVLPSPAPVAQDATPEIPDNSPDQDPSIRPEPPEDPAQPPDLDQDGAALNDMLEDLKDRCRNATSARAMEEVGRWFMDLKLSDEERKPFTAVIQERNKELAPKPAAGKRSQF